MEERVDVQLHSFLTSPLDLIVLPASRPGLYTSERDRPVPLKSGHGGPQNWSGHLAEKKNLILAGNRKTIPLLPSPLPSLYTNYAIQAHK